MSDKIQGGILAGTVDVSLPVLLLKVADQTGKTGSVAADMVLSYWRQGGVRVAVPASNLAAVNSAHSDGGVKEVDATFMPGQYRVDWPDAAFAAGADWVMLTVLATDTFGASQGCVLTSNVIQTGESFVRIGVAGAGLTAITNKTDNLPTDPADQSLVIAATAAIINDTGAIKIKTDQLAFGTANRVNAQVFGMEANVMTAAAAAADLATELQSGLATAAALTTAAGEVTAVKAKTDSLTFTVSGRVDSNVESVNGTNLGGAGTVANPWGPA